MRNVFDAVLARKVALKLCRRAKIAETAVADMSSAVVIIRANGFVLSAEMSLWKSRIKL